jgi:hypothetical protein
MAYYQINRGVLDGIGVTLSRGGNYHNITAAWVRPTRVGGEYFWWRIDDKRLIDLHEHGGVTDDEALALILDCLPPAKRAWMTRWMREGW